MLSAQLIQTPFYATQIILSVAVENNHQFARPNILLISNNSLPDKELHVPLQRVLVEMSINEELFYVTESSDRKGRNHFHLSLTSQLKSPYFDFILSRLAL